MRNDKFWDECNDDSIRHDVAAFIDNSPILQKFKGIVYYQLEDALVNFIEDIKQKIYEEVEKESKREDVVGRIEDQFNEIIANALPLNYLDFIVNLWNDNLSNNDGYWEGNWESLDDVLVYEPWFKELCDLTEEESWIYAAYLKQWFSDHDYRSEAPVCAEEFFNNEMKDDELSSHYKRLAKELKDVENQSNI